MTSRVVFCVLVFVFVTAATAFFTLLLYPPSAESWTSLLNWRPRWPGEGNVHGSDDELFMPTGVPGHERILLTCPSTPELSEPWLGAPTIDHFWNATQLPTIFLLGCAKCGSSTIHGVLTHHPDILVPTLAPGDPQWMIKEPGFFSVDLRFERGFEAYAEKFPPRNVTTAWPQQAIDATAQMGIVSSPSRIAACYASHTPTLKFLVVLRNPTLRALSWFHHAHRAGWLRLVDKNQSFSSLVTQHLALLRSLLPSMVTKDGGFTDDPVRWEFILRRNLYSVIGGLYAPQLRLWFRYFPRSQFRVLDLRTFTATPRTVITKVLRFLQLSPGSFAIPTLPALPSPGSLVSLTFFVILHASFLASSRGSPPSSCRPHAMEEPAPPPQRSRTQHVHSAHPGRHSCLRDAR